VCWGAACLIKPYVALPGLLTWLTSAALVRRSGPGWVRRLTWDAGGLLAGGLLMLALWQGWLLACGTWGDYWHNYAEYHGDYYSTAPSRLDRAYALFVLRLRPWGWLHLLVLLIAVLLVFGSVVWTARRAAGRPAPSLTLLFAFYLGWVTQASLVQLADDYQLAPAVMLALTLIAGLVWRPGARWLGVLLFAFVIYAVVAQPACDRKRLALWGRCWTDRDERRLRADLALRPDGPDWVALAEVADYLRGQGVKDGEVLCYNAHTCHLYIDLGLTPPTRFLIPDVQITVFSAHRAAMRAEVRAGRQRYVVSDVGAWGWVHEEAPPPAGQPVALPPGFPPEVVARYPFSEKPIFRAGRYYVHEASSPPTDR
jgi:hypothetical protein